MERNCTIDNMKGLGILLMVFGHSSIPYYPLYKAIFTFHMPLFFILSGYLYKERGWGDILHKYYNRIIRPYVWCLIICTPICFYIYRGDWFLTCFFTKNVPLVCGFEWRGYIGPLWFLLAYFNAMLMFKIVRRIDNKIIEAIVLLLLFEIAMVVLWRWNSVFPFQISQATGGALFVFLGYLGKDIKESQKLWAMIIICLLLYIPVAHYGSLSMASMEYKLNLLQIVGGFSGTVLLYFFVRNWKFDWLAWIGRNTLPILCFHSIDYHYMGGAKIASLICDKSQCFFFIVEFFAHIMVIYILWLVFSRIGYLKKVYSLQTQ